MPPETKDKRHQCSNLLYRFGSGDEWPLMLISCYSRFGRPTTKGDRFCIRPVSSWMPKARQAPSKPDSKNCLQLSWSLLTVTEVWMVEDILFNYLPRNKPLFIVSLKWYRLEENQNRISTSLGFEELEKRKFYWITAYIYCHKDWPDVNRMGRIMKRNLKQTFPR